MTVHFLSLLSMGKKSINIWLILKCLNVVRMSIFNYLFMYFYFQEIFAVLGEPFDINLEPKKISS